MPFFRTFRRTMMNDSSFIFEPNVAGRALFFTLLCGTVFLFLGGDGVWFGRHLSNWREFSSPNLVDGVHMYPELTLPNLLSCLPITSQEQTWKNSYKCPLQGDYFKGKGWSSNHHFWGAKCFQESFHCSSGSLQTLLVMFHLFCGKKEMDSFAPFLVAKMIAPL